MEVRLHYSIIQKDILLLLSALFLTVRPRFFWLEDYLISRDIRPDRPHYSCIGGVFMHIDSIDNAKIISELARKSTAKSKIDPSLYERYNVKRGLRNDDGTGVLVGLTEVGEVMSYIVDDAERVPVQGRLFYQGIEISDIVSGFYEDGRFGFEETAYLLLFGELPTTAQLEQFNSLLVSCRDLPHNFTEDMILKAPSPDIMNKLARSVLALYSYDKNPDALDIDNVLRQCIELIARFPVMISHAFMAKLHYVDKQSLLLHAPVPYYNTAQN